MPPNTVTSPSAAHRPSPAPAACPGPHAAHPQPPAPAACSAPATSAAGLEPAAIAASTMISPVSPVRASAIRLGALVRHNATLLLREPGPMLSRLIMPLVLITLMRPLYLAALARYGQQAGTAQVVTGMLVMFSLLALSIVGTTILSERSWHTWDRLRATSATAPELFAGKVIPAFGVLLAQQAVVLTFGALAFGLTIASPGLLAVAVASWGLAILGIGALLGASVRSQSELAVCYDIGGVALTALAGGLVPLTALPGWARAAAPASPGYWALSALRAAIDGHPAATLRACGVLLAIATGTGALACWRISRGWARSRLL
jgi:ABC-2 type transport system permease protein